MNKKKLCLLLASTMMSFSVCALALLANKKEGIIYAKTEAENKIVLNQSINKFHNYVDSTAYSGESTIQTNLGNDIEFSYENLMGSESAWHIIKNGGCFYNTTAIHGLESISLLFGINEKEFRIYWSYTTLFDDDDSQDLVSSSFSEIIFDFKTDYPSHFKFVNTSGSDLDILEIKLSFTCHDSRPTTKQWKKAHGIIPSVSNDGKTITYGLYPQTNIEDSLLLHSLNELTTKESNGWYFYNGEYYAKVYAQPYHSRLLFDNGTTIGYGHYWFKCEPIVWNVLNYSNSKYFIVSSVVLDAHRYNSSDERIIGEETIYPNNYEYSEIRTWLNGTFFNTIFSLDDNCVLTTIVENDPSTTNGTDGLTNPYGCNNTEDIIFLPSYKDYLNSNYGFSTNTNATDTRACKATDWARARGVWGSKGDLQNHNSVYWTRSPDVSGPRVWSVSVNGILNVWNYSVYTTSVGVRPAIMFSGAHLI